MTSASDPDGPPPPPADYDEVYDELRAMARQRLASERDGHTLQATALAHEAYLRLSARRATELPDTPVERDAVVPDSDPGTGDWDSRAHFFGAAARAMQQVLLDHARARGRKKRVGGRTRLPLSVADLAVHADVERVLEVQQAVEQLEQRDARLAEIVRLRFYAGLSETDTAEALGVSARTVRRDWALARAWLGRELGGDALD